MDNLDEIQAELTALTKNIEMLDRQFNDGTLSEVFYFKRRVSLIRDQEITLKKLKDFLVNNNAQEVSFVLDKVTSGAKDTEIEEELKKAQEAGSSKGWGEAIKETIKEKKGSIVQVAIAAALKVAKFFL